ncbi:hypothetical protein VTK73DRAFT_5902 [Phialemonium thermophilum]|uniref:RRM domain-containing protein n=1 Tax=Phialemonium thermophilum TaxID=223376 RepID=A0ABR3WLE4_9PEZI
MAVLGPTRLKIPLLLPLPLPDRRPAYTSSYGTSNYGTGDRGGYHSIRDNLPQKLPEKPPYTAHLGNLSYDATVDTLNDFFAACNPISVRIIEDREQNRPKGFAYVEFADLEGLKTALTYDGKTFEGRSIRIKVADPPKDRMGGESTRDFSDWTRKGPLADLPPRGGDRRASGHEFDRRGSREPAGSDDGKVRDFNNWERRGPLSPLPQADRPPRDGSRSRTLESRSESYRTRRASPAWGPGEARQDGSRPPRREFSDRPERVPSAAERDISWRSNMRPDPQVRSPVASREGSEAPPSPAAQVATLASGRPKLQLAKRTVSEAPATSPATSTSDSKSSPFGGARPIDTAAREREIEEKRLAALKAKKEAEEKEKEERRLAKEAAAKEAAAKEAAEKEAAEKAAAEKIAAEKAQADAASAAEEAAKKEGEVAEGNKADGGSDESKTTAAHEGAASTSAQNGEQKVPSRPREPRGESAASNRSPRAFESGNWRQPSGEQRSGGRGGHIPSGPRRGGPPRGPRGESGRPPRGGVNGNGPTTPRQPQTPQTPTTAEADPAAPEEEGWTVVNKARRSQNVRPPVSS